jgi:hypothetical protein
MEKKIIEAVVTCIINNLALAHGGRSQYDWNTLGKALKGHLSQGNLQGADIEGVLDAAMDLEIEWYNWSHFPDHMIANIRRQIQDGIEK